MNDGERYSTRNRGRLCRRGGSLGGKLVKNERKGGIGKKKGKNLGPGKS